MGFETPAERNKEIGDCAPRSDHQSVKFNWRQMVFLAVILNSWLIDVTFFLVGRDWLIVINFSPNCRVNNNYCRWGVRLYGYDVNSSIEFGFWHSMDLFINMEFPLFEDLSDQGAIFVMPGVSKHVTMGTGSEDMGKSFNLIAAALTGHTLAVIFCI